MSGVDVPRIVSSLSNPWRAESEGEVRATVLTEAETIFFGAGTPIPGHEGQSLKRFLTAEIEATADGYLVRSRELDEEGYGASREEAIADFLSSLVDRLRSLERRTGPLAEIDQSILNRLRQLL